jgi:hypothetical protein
MIKRIALAAAIAIAPTLAAAQDANSPILNLLLMGSGLHTNNWGSNTNANLTIVENAIKGSSSIVTTGGTTSLTQTQAGTALLLVTGALTSNATLSLPSGVTNIIGVANRTTGAFTLTVNVTGGSGVAVAQNTTQLIFSDGTNAGRMGAESDALTPSQGATYLPKSGGTMTGTLNMGNNYISNLADPGSGAYAVSNASVRLVPSGAVVGFYPGGCPSGWANNAAWNGVYLRGRDLGRGQDPAGDLGAGTYEGDAVGPHTHTVTNISPVYSISFNTTLATANFTGGYTNVANLTQNFSYLQGTAVTGNPSTGGYVETRVRSAVVYNCQKN